MPEKVSAQGRVFLVASVEINHTIVDLVIGRFEHLGIGRSVYDNDEISISVQTIRKQCVVEFQPLVLTRKKHLDTRCSKVYAAFLHAS
jgi:hypothetical protein